MGMKISVDWLVNHDACHEGIARFAEQCGVEYEDTDSGLSDYSKEFDILSLVDGANDNGDLLWLASKLVESGVLELTRVMDFVNSAGKIAAQIVCGFAPASKYAHLEKAFDGGGIDGNCLEILSCLRISTYGFPEQHAARLVWALVWSLELKQLWLGGDEFEKAGFPQAEFNRLMTELLSHAKSK